MYKIAKKVILIFLNISLVVTLVLSVTLYYLPSKNNRVKSKCSIVSCTTELTTCTEQCDDPTDNKCGEYNCYDMNLKYMLKIKSKKYYQTDTLNFLTEEQAEDYCDKYPVNSTTTCYYDKRNPGNTLSLSKFGYLILQGIVITICCIVLLGLTIFNIIYFIKLILSYSLYKLY